MSDDQKPLTGGEKVILATVCAVQMLVKERCVGTDAELKVAAWLVLTKAAQALYDGEIANSPEALAVWANLGDGEPPPASSN